MIQLHFILRIALLSTLTVGCLKAAEEPYQPKLDSLSRHEDAPEWFRDAKLGIYFHWGVYSVPAWGSESYPRNMYNIKGSEYAHHAKTWGDPAEFEYADFVPLFKAEHFDADQWAKLFKKAGARFAGPVAEHHDGFSMWDSKVTPWNAKDKGPGRDITGELEKAIHKQEMRFITTFHHARNNLWEKKPNQWSGHYSFVKEYFPSLLGNPENAILYGYIPREQFIKMWQAKLKEVIDRYRPDIIWFDSWLDEIPEQARFEFAAYYFNSAKHWKKDVVIVRKQEDMPLEFSVLDHEKARTTGSSPRVWMTDDTISTGSWCYTQNLKIKTVEKVVHALIDTVSKNGVVLLNISPKADGTIPDDQRQVLLQLGDWMRINGEGIYDTRPWDVYGEGPTKEPQGGFSEAGKFLKIEYSAKDMRYTQSKDHKTLYIIPLGWPKDGFSPEKLRVIAADRARIRLLGSDKPVPFEVQADRSLKIRTDLAGPAQLPYACVFKLEGFEFNSVK
ncbi:MAG: alpha-L-fucosidase [Victivallales bacterium]|nr:alpha-L-fucosidase [Victivallales bacterium]